MENSLSRFFAELVQYFSEQEVIQYVCYDGSSAPNRIAHNPLFIMESKTSFEHTRKWLAKYLASNRIIHYYELFKAFTKETADLWVDPTLEELKKFNINNGLNQDAHLKNYQSFQEKKKELAIKNLSDTLNIDGYSVYRGEELVNHLIHLYDLYNRKDQSIIEWIEPIDLSLIDSERYYIVDREVFVKPAIVNHHLLEEYKDREFNISPLNLPLYLEHALVTKRGIESREVMKDKQMTVYFYQEMTHYLQENEYESLDTAYQKLFKNKVDPSQPFVEIIADNYTECYMNDQKLRTENDLLSFMNEAYRIEGLDLEAKSFNRKEILRQLLMNSFQEDASINYGNEKHSGNNWDDKKLSFK